jgi:hypothetical protein
MNLQHKQKANCSLLRMTNRAIAALVALMCTGSSKRSAKCMQAAYLSSSIYFAFEHFLHVREVLLRG